jgi:hypothetical protein
MVKNLHSASLNTVSTTELWRLRDLGRADDIHLILAKWSEGGNSMANRRVQSSGSSTTPQQPRRSHSSTGSESRPRQGNHTSNRVSAASQKSRTPQRSAKKSSLKKYVTALRNSPFAADLGRVKQKITSSFTAPRGKGEKSRTRSIASKAVFAVLIALAAIEVVQWLWPSSHFFPGQHLDGVSVGWQSADSAEKKLMQGHTQNKVELTDSQTWRWRMLLLVSTLRGRS